MATLTKKSVDAAAADPARERFLWDDRLRGFGLRVKPSGAKSLVIQYRNAHGQSRRLTICRVGEMTPDQARERARALIAAVRDGEDPAADRRAAREAATVADLVDTYLRDGPAANPGKKQSSWRTDESNLRRHVVPLLGTRPVATLTRADIERFQADVAAGKSAAKLRTKARGVARVAGGSGTAGRTLAVLAAMLNFAVDRGLIATNVARGVRRPPQRLRERFLSEAEVARLAATIAEMEAAGDVNGTVAAAIRLLMLTGARKGEVLALRWSEVDFERGVLRLPDSKTGAKVIPLGAPALELLAGLPRNGERVFPGWIHGSAATIPHKAWRLIVERAELSGLRIHDLRHSFASFAVASGESLFLVGKVLGHRQSRTTEGYAHLSNDPLRAVADRTGRRIADAMRPGTAGVVVPLAKG
ncbi:MAG: tyrosine-type recombinase/integrase [Rhodospirillales bacterium]